MVNKPQQSTMFESGEDLPLFTGSPIRIAEVVPDHSPQAQRQYLPGMAPTFDELATAHREKRTRKAKGKKHVRK